MQYDLHPGVVIETDKVLDVDEVDDARKRLEKGETIEKVAKRLGGKPYSPAEPQPTTHVMVDQEMLVAAMGEERAAELIRESKPGKQRGA